MLPLCRHRKGKKITDLSSTLESDLDKLELDDLDEDVFLNNSDVSHKLNSTMNGEREL